MLKMRINNTGLSVPHGTLNLFLLTKNQNVMAKMTVKQLKIPFAFEREQKYYGYVRVCKTKRTTNNQYVVRYFNDKPNK